MWLHIPNLDVCTSAQDTEVLSLDSDLPEFDPDLYVTSNATALQRPLSWRGWQRRTWIKLLSGTISQPLMANRGATEWISSLPVSLVSPSVSQDHSWELTTTAGSGLPSNESFVTWDPVLSSWKTSPNLFGEVCLLSSLILPSSGSMRNGVCTQRPRLAHRTNVNASGSWPTPRASMNENRTTKNAPSHGVTHGETLAGTVSSWATPRAVNPPRSSAHGTAGPTLNEQAVGRQSDRLWGTPVANDDQKTPEAHIVMKQRLLNPTPTAAVTSLTVQVKLWPTPAAHDPKDLAVSPSQMHRNSQMLPVAAVLHGLQERTETGPSTSPRVELNPRFVEALMGLPKGWLTPCTLVETDSFQQWLRQHSLSYIED